MQILVKSKFTPQIPETLVHEFLQTNPKSPLSWAPRIILPWPASLLPSGVLGSRTATTVADQDSAARVPVLPLHRHGSGSRSADPTSGARRA